MLFQGYLRRGLAADNQDSGLGKIIQRTLVGAISGVCLGTAFNGFTYRESSFVSPTIRWTNLGTCTSIGAVSMLIFSVSHVGLQTIWNNNDYSNVFWAGAIMGAFLSPFNYANIAAFPYQLTSVNEKLRDQFRDQETRIRQGYHERWQESSATESYRIKQQVAFDLESQNHKGFSKLAFYGKSAQKAFVAFMSELFVPNFTPTPLINKTGVVQRRLYLTDSLTFHTHIATLSHPEMTTELSAEPPIIRMKPLVHGYGYYQIHNMIIYGLVFGTICFVTNYAYNNDMLILAPEDGNTDHVKVDMDSHDSKLRGVKRWRHGYSYAAIEDRKRWKKEFEKNHINIW